MELDVIGRKGISYEDTAIIWVRDPVSLDKDGGSGENRGIRNRVKREEGGRIDKIQ